jgi:Animal haem peroxidase
VGWRGRWTHRPAAGGSAGCSVDHDITFDPTSKLQGDNDPRALVDFRTPRFDLDSLYASGPKDQPFLYDWSPQAAPGVKRLVGSNAGDGAITYDLPRNEQGRALISDARNDEHLIISQLHLLFIRFHNRVVDRVLAQQPALRGMALLEEAQRIVRRHYQWIVVHDFLPRIVGRKAAAAAGVERRFYRWKGAPFIPFEFSVAAYRFGHSMVRGDYKPNGRVQRAVPIFAKADEPGELDHLGGFRRLPVALTIDWAFFFPLSGQRPPDPDRPQQSRLIDTNLAPGLFSLPASVDSQRQPLPRLNLLRGRALKLPAGSAVARAMGVEPLTDRELLLDDIWPASARDAVRRAPPLWYYVLCEAQSRHGNRGRHLGPVGGGIVAEVLVGLLEADPSSYLRAEPGWKPTLPRASRGTFTMADLVRFTLRDD